MFFYFYHRTNDNKPDTESLLKAALSHHNERMDLGFAKEEINAFQIFRENHGKPYIPQLIDTISGRESLHFSISHSGPWWACIFSDIPVGLDIEEQNFSNMEYSQESSGKRRRKRDFEAIAKRFFTEEESQYVKKNGEKSFFELWVRKEAYIKMKGTGLSEGLASFHLLHDGRLAEKIEGAYFTPIPIKSKLEAVFCSGEKRFLLQMVELKDRNGGGFDVNN